MAAISTAPTAAATLHEYADNTIHTLQTESGSTIEVRLKRSLCGDKGFSQACVFVAECMTKDSPHFGRPFVLKIFDPRYSRLVCRRNGVRSFDPEALSYVARAVDSGEYQRIAEQLVWTFKPHGYLSKRTLKILSDYGDFPPAYGELVRTALTSSATCEALVADGVITEPHLGYRELFVWILSQHMFEHEAEMHRKLSSVHNAPVVRLREVVSIKPKSLVSVMPCMSFGAIMMDYVDGCTASALQDVCALEGDSFERAPACIRNLIPRDDKSMAQFSRALNRLIQWPVTVGIQAQDHHLDNIMCRPRANGKGIDLIWIDVGQFYPLFARQYSQTKPTWTIPDNMRLERCFMLVDESIEDIMYERFEFVHWHSASTFHIDNAKLQRAYRPNAAVSKIFAWRLIMEALMIGDWFPSEKPTDVRESILLLEMVRTIINREESLYSNQQWLTHRDMDRPQKQIWFHAAVLKLHYILSGSRSGNFDYGTWERGRETVLRFEDLMSQADFPQALVAGERDGNGDPLPLDEEFTVANVENIVKLLKYNGHGIFGIRSWREDWSIGKVLRELTHRFQQVMKLECYCSITEAWLAEELDDVDDRSVDSLVNLSTDLPLRIVNL